MPRGFDRSRREFWSIHYGVNVGVIDRGLDLFFLTDSYQEKKKRGHSRKIRVNFTGSTTCKLGIQTGKPPNTRTIEQAKGLGYWIRE